MWITRAIQNSFLYFLCNFRRKRHTVVLIVLCRRQTTRHTIWCGKWCDKPNVELWILLKRKRQWTDVQKGDTWRTEWWISAVLSHYDLCGWWEEPLFRVVIGGCLQAKPKEPSNIEENKESTNHFDQNIFIVPFKLQICECVCNHCISSHSHYDVWSTRSVFICWMNDIL